MTLETPPPSPSYKDTKTGLVTFGILEILIAAVLSLSLLSSLLGPLIARATGNTAIITEPRLIIPTVATLGMLVVGFAWLGIGSIKSRRWAQALSLCVGWIGLVCGILGCIALVWTLPAIDATMRQASARTGQELPGFVILVAKIMTVLVTIVMYVLIPGALVLFFRRRDVRLTCEARDPVPRWTDRCPLPVLAIVLTQAFGAGSMLCSIPSYGRVLPLFGVLVEGFAAQAIYLVVAATSIYFAWGFYQRKLAAYWGYLGMLVVFGTSAFTTFMRMDLLSYYQAIGLPDAHLKILESMPLVHSHGVIWFGAVIGLVFLGYLLWLKRYFAGRAPATAAAPG